MLEKLKEQIALLERAASDENTEVNFDAVKTVLFDASQRIEVLEKENTDSKAEAERLKPVAAIGEKRIVEVKEETLRMLGVICEHTETKDMGRRDRMKERFEKETLDFEAVSRYFDDAKVEFDKLFPAEPAARAASDEDELATRVTVDVSSFKIKA